MKYRSKLMVSCVGDRYGGKRRVREQPPGAHIADGQACAPRLHCTAQAQHGGPLQKHVQDVSICASHGTLALPHDEVGCPCARQGWRRSNGALATLAALALLCLVAAMGPAPAAAITDIDLGGAIPVSLICPYIT